MLTRREFLRLCTSAACACGLSRVLSPFLGEAYARAEAEKPPLIWLELGSCTGNSVSLFDAKDPDFKYFLTEMVDFRYHWLLTAAQDQTARDLFLSTVEEEKGRYFLVIEGSVVTAGDGTYNYVFFEGDRPVTGKDLLLSLAPQAKHIIAVGSCATWGGPSAAYPNPSKSQGVQDFLKRKVINVPGCPAHPDWIIGTIGHLILYGVPELDHLNRPTMFFGQTIHDLCERRSQFENGEFAKFPGQRGCLYKVGCKGPVTFADCPKRQWNNHINWPVKANTPCIGCVNPGFPDSSEPFFSPLPDISLPNIKVNATKVGLTAGGITAAAIAGHFTASVLRGRIGKHLVGGTVPQKPLSEEKQFDEALKQILSDQKKIIKQIDALPRKKRNIMKITRKLVPRKDD
ncbi:hydrogenase small subunit [Candidatus Formimonas warabiya]|uniref:Hydrogenase n=1 Tax=Formimonas warabiya TaxID=1761012 RepID=A0A3G1KUV9_FORW1|nr:hydrogenase small subunit [Candidatus Formimonas warabiya]ATW26207.1 hydrogenase [Candidatus Formimonas warabiya]